MTHSVNPDEPHSTSDDETLSMIRAMLPKDPESKPTRKAVQKKADRLAVSHQTAQAIPSEAQVVSPEVAPVETEDAEGQARNAATRNHAAFVELDASEEPATERWTSRVTSAARRQVNNQIAKLRAYRPSPRHLAIVSTLLLLVVRPHWFVFGVILTVAVVVGAFMVLGEDRIWGAVIRRLSQIEAKNPERAVELRDRLDRFAYRWDSVLDYFPDGMVDGLYMPDFQSLEQAEERHATAMSERLARMGQEG